MTTMDKILADLFKGAAQNGKTVEMDVQGREEKLAGLGGALGAIPLMGIPMAGMGSGLQDESGPSAFYSGLGALGGQLGGATLGGMLGNSPALGTMIGGGLGGHFGQEYGRKEKQKKREAEKEKTSALRDAFVQGMNAAAERFKVANFLQPLIGMGASALGATGVGKLLGSRAGGFGGQVLQNLGGQVAQSGAERLMQPHQPAMMPFTR